MTLFRTVNWQRMQLRTTTDIFSCIWQVDKLHEYIQGGY
jgi:hypothetical protein